MKRAVFGVTALALAGLAGFAGTPAAADDPITIGLALGLSPPADAGLGQLCRRGAELGVEYVNTVMGGALGRKVQISVQDTQAKNEAGVAAKDVARLDCPPEARQTHDRTEPADPGSRPHRGGRAAVGRGAGREAEALRDYMGRIEGESATTAP